MEVFVLIKVTNDVVTVEGVFTTEENAKLARLGDHDSYEIRKFKLDDERS